MEGQNLIPSPLPPLHYLVTHKCSTVGNVRDQRMTELFRLAPGCRLLTLIPISTKESSAEMFSLTCSSEMMASRSAFSAWSRCTWDFSCLTSFSGARLPSWDKHTLHELTKRDHEPRSTQPEHNSVLHPFSSVQACLKIPQYNS